MSNTCQLTPLGDYVAVVRDEAKNVTEGGILLPDVAKRKTTRGTVVAVGPGKKDDKGNVVPMTLKVQDRVLFPTYSGSEVRVGVEEYLLIHEADVLAVLDERPR